MRKLVLKNGYIRAMGGLRAAADAVGLLATLERSQRRELVWVRSLFGIYNSADLIQLDLPWWTFRAIDRVSEFLERRGRGARVFEFGAGASTVWLAKRAAEVVSVEHDAAFAEQLREPLSHYRNVRLQVVPPVPASGRLGEALSHREGYESLAFDEYVASVERESGLFDLVIIDGRSRAACLAASRAKLAPGGIILFDNSDRSEYRQALSSCGLAVEHLRGMAPALPFPSETSLLSAGT